MINQLKHHQGGAPHGHMAQLHRPEHPRGHRGERQQPRHSPAGWIQDPRAATHLFLKNI